MLDVESFFSILYILVVIGAAFILLRSISK